MKIRAGIKKLQIEPKPI